MKSSEMTKVCIAGDKDFAEYFRKLQAAHKQGITIRISELLSYSEIPTCQLLLIGRNEEENAVSLLAYINRHPVLSISEAKNFADNGGIIEIVRVDKNVGLFSQDKINLRINLKAAEIVDLSIDARLLQIAVEVIN